MAFALRPDLHEHPDELAILRGQKTAPFPLGVDLVLVPMA